MVEKYFIAEGVVNKHSLVVGSQDVDPRSIVSSFQLVTTNKYNMGI